MGEAAVTYSDLTIVTSDNPRLEDPMDIIAEIEAGIDKGKVKKIEAENIKLNGNGNSYTVIPERKKAIEAAIKAAGKEDIILIAGKGHENYQEIKGIKYHFDDREIVREIFNLMSEN
jgi:UDP-N-acetylmuramoyl-L-alanyl-D-glutamate--2,6-diaminopimelate ligase